jgi:hypothetical protein
LVGHITRDELLRYLDRTEIGNGFANRFLWILVRRSQSLPEGGSLGQDELTELREALAEATSYATSAGVLARDDDARGLWRARYKSLSDGAPGMFGAVTSRAEAQVLRLSCVYALMDSSPVVARRHLAAALAFWRYASDSARYIFGEATGDPVADDILRALRSRDTPMTRTDIRDLFQKNRSSEQISRALNLLEEAGLVCRATSRRDGGRPPEIWALTASFELETTATTITTKADAVPDSVVLSSMS